MQRLWVAAAVVAVALVGLPARADVEEARTHAERGTRAFNLQDWRGALTEFQRAYVEHSDPVLIYDIGQVQRQLGQYEAASKSYRLYLANQPNAPNHEQVMRLIGEMDKATAEARAKSPPTGTQAPSVAVTREVPRSTEWYKSPLGWTLGAGGATLGVLGVGLLVHGNALDAQIPGASSLAQVQQLGHDRDTFRLAGDVIIAVGGAALVAGVIVLIAKANHRPRPMEVHRAAR